MVISLAVICDTTVGRLPANVKSVTSDLKTSLNAWQPGLKGGTMTFVQSGRKGWEKHLTGYRNFTMGFIVFLSVSARSGAVNTQISCFNSLYQHAAFALGIIDKANGMNDDFPIKINDIVLTVKKLNFKNYCGAYEIWKKDNIQFILVHNVSKRIHHAWNVDHDESSNVSQKYINEIVSAIEFHYNTHKNRVS